ncbi:uncharacterized protein [Centruroides vittatus]|uniref:uncharacterized protein n=1 Tax=Centruroides vittatus TaxID=120091 RepID=UPI00350F2199
MLQPMLDDLIHLAQRMMPQQRNVRNNGRRRNHQHSHQLDHRRNSSYAVEASRIQRLYRSNRRKAFDEIVRGTERFCDIGKAELTEHFYNTYSSALPSSNSLILPPALQPSTDSQLCDAFTPSEVAARLNKCRNTAPGPDGIRYYIWRPMDPQGHILAALFNAVQCIGFILQCWQVSTTILLHKKGDPRNINN